MFVVLSLMSPNALAHDTVVVAPAHPQTVVYVESPQPRQVVRVRQFRRPLAQRTIIIQRPARQAVYVAPTPVYRARPVQRVLVLPARRAAPPPTLALSLNTADLGLSVAYQAPPPRRLRRP